MLSIRMQRLGRKGHPVYRVVVQDKRQSPTSGKYIALLGSYDPHTKTASITKDKAEHYLKNGAQPSERVVKLFMDEKINLPNWVVKPGKQERKIRNPEKLRKNRPAEAPVPEETSSEESAEAATENNTAEENTAKAEDDSKPAETAAESPEEETKAEESPKTESAETTEDSSEEKA